MNREFFFAEGPGVRRADLRSPQDRAAIREFLTHERKRLEKRRRKPK